MTIDKPGDEFYVGGSDEAWLAVQPLDAYGRLVANAYPLELGRWAWLRWDESGSRWALAEGRSAFHAPRPFERAVPLASAVAEQDAGVEEDAEPETTGAEPSEGEPDTPEASRTEPPAHDG